MEFRTDNLNLRITQIKPRFVNRELLAEIVVESIAKLDPAKPTTKRWINAIGKAVAMIEANNKMVFDIATHTLTIHGSKGDVYKSNGVCQCEAYSNNKQPCYHRAASRLMLRYVEMTQAMPF